MLKTLSKNIKKFRWIFSGVLFLLVVLLSGSWYISGKIKPFVQQELGQAVNQATNGLYHIKFDQVNVNPLTGRASLSEVRLTPDTSVYRKLVLEKKAPNNLYLIDLHRLRIKRFHPLKIYLQKKLEIDLLLFESPHITMINKALVFNEDKPPQPEKSPYDYVKKIFNSLHIKTIKFENASFKYIDNNGAIANEDTISNVSITLKDWLIDSVSAKDKTRFYLLKDAYVYLHDYKYATPDSLYYLKATQFEFSASAKKLKIKEFVVEPRYSEKEFAKVNGYARDRYSFRLNDIDFNGLKLLSYIRNREVIADKVTIANGMLAVFNDNSYPKLNKNKTGKFPYQLFQTIKIPITFKEVILKKLDIRYAEFDSKTKQRGKISFEKTSGVITNVTNQPKQKKINPIITANLESHLMGQGKLRAAFKFNLAAPKADFSYQGSLTNMDARKLNYITKPLAMLQIKSCLVDRFDFDIKANQDFATGKVTLKYNDLSLGLMAQHEGGERLKRLGLLSLLTNAMIISSDNPTDGENLRVESIYYTRKPTSSFFSYLWHTLYQGVRYSIGYTPQKEAEIKRYVKRFEDIKNDRENRKLRREERKRYSK